jgi:hypothetical protein
MDTVPCRRPEVALRKGNIPRTCSARSWVMPECRGWCRREGLIDGGAGFALGYHLETPHEHHLTMASCWELGILASLLEANRVLLRWGSPAIGAVGRGGAGCCVMSGGTFRSGWRMWSSALDDACEVRSSILSHLHTHTLEWSVWSCWTETTSLSTGVTYPWWSTRREMEPEHQSQPSNYTCFFWASNYTCWGAIWYRCRRRGHRIFESVAWTKGFENGTRLIHSNAASCVGFSLILTFLIYF